MSHAVKAEGVIIEQKGDLFFKVIHGDECRQNMRAARYIPGEMVTVTIKSVERDITDPQRRYYRGVVVPIFAEYMGEPDLEEVHEELAWRFLRIEDHPVSGRPRRKSTARGKMGDDEMRDFLDRVIAFGTVSHGLRFPEPEKNPAKREPRRRRAA